MTVNRKPRPWLGINFTCCKVYGRAYKNLDKKNYQAICPKCARRMTFVVGNDGKADRFFSVK